MCLGVNSLTQSQTALNEHLSEWAPEQDYAKVYLVVIGPGSKTIWTELQGKSLRVTTDSNTAREVDWLELVSYIQLRSKLKMQVQVESEKWHSAIPAKQVSSKRDLEAKIKESEARIEELKRNEAAERTRRRPTPLLK